MQSQLDQDLTPTLSAVYRSEFRTIAWSMNLGFIWPFWPSACCLTPIGTYMQSPRRQTPSSSTSKSSATDAHVETTRARSSYTPWFGFRGKGYDHSQNPA